MDNGIAVQHSGAGIGSPYSVAGRYRGTNQLPFDLHAVHVLPKGGGKQTYRDPPGGEGDFIDRGIDRRLLIPGA